MAMRVYECDRSESQALKKALEYDPYLDSNVIPSSPKSADLPPEKQSPEQKQEMAEHERKVKEAMAMLSKDPRAQAIFARQSCSLRDGAILGLNPDKLYLCIDAPDDFFPKAEERLKNEFKTVKRAPKQDEDKAIEAIRNEEAQASAGFSAIFGGG